MAYYIGVDIGSTCAKTVVLDENQSILLHQVQPTGWSSVDTAASILKVLQSQGFSPEENPCVATGYGRVAVPFADKTVTEITCHARGACQLFEQTALTVIDIGGQDTKIIAVENGMVKDFVMNDKCSAGTGRFLEVMANTLGLRPEELCQLSTAGSGVSISSMCTVFAESEVISLIGRGEKRENIAFAVVDSIIKKVASQMGRVSERPAPLVLTGGLCQCEPIRKALEQELRTPVLTHPLGRYAGAIGAAKSAASVKK